MNPDHGDKPGNLRDEHQDLIMKWYEFMYQPTWEPYVLDTLSQLPTLPEYISQNIFCEKYFR